MKLSDIKGERVFDVIADIVPPIANIVEDETASELFKRKPLPEGMTVNAFLLRRAKQALPALLKDHKDDLITILSTIEGVEKKDYCDSLNLVKLTKDFVELFSDEAFSEVFISARSEN